MKHRFLVSVLSIALVAAVSGQAPATWAMNGTIIEACSCPMFCQCYFNPHPAEHTDQGQHKGHGKGTYCRFNNAVKVNSGHHGSVKLDGAKFWVAGDLGDDFTQGQMDWAVLTFDPAVTKEQRAAIAEILPRLYPVKWNSFSVANDAAMEWTATKDRAVARLDGGKAAEVILNRSQGMNDGPSVLTNVPYWGAPRNDGFVMMKNEVQAYRLGEKAFEYKGTNGFMITFDIDSKTAPPPAK
jgi:hypothetical protein